MSSSHATKKPRGGSNPPKGAAASRADTSTTTSQTIYERQEVETRTRRSPNNSALQPSTPEKAVAGLTGSPTLTRQQEKEELKFLNNRLANYIETIHAQQEEISVLRRKVETVSSKETQENTKIKDRYNLEINNLRKALDEVSRDLAAATIDRDALLPDKKEREKLEGEKKNLVKKLKDAEVALKDTRAQLNALKDQVKDHATEVGELSQNNEALKIQVDSLKKDLHRETNQRVDAENRLQSEREKNSLLESVHSEEMTSLRRQRITEVTEVETRMHDEYQSKFLDQLEELRADMEDIAMQTREEMERNYTTQLNDLRNMADINAADSKNLFADLKATQERLKELQTRADKHANELRDQIQKLQGDLGGKDHEIQRLQQLLSDRQMDLQKTHMKLTRQLQSDMEQLDDKIQLDAELATYNALITSEEKLHGIPSPPFPSTPESQRKSQKRRLDSSFTRTQFLNEATATGDVNISEIDGDGQFVRLENKSTQDVVVGSWNLHMVSDDGIKTETKYKIHTNQTIKGHSTMTIWSGTTNVIHEPPNDIVMEGRWLIGDHTVVTLSNSDGVEVARRTMTRSAAQDSFVGSSGVKRARLNRTAALNGEEKNCIIM